MLGCVQRNKQAIELEAVLEDATVAAGKWVAE
jgi:hypothetical protein